LGVNNLIKLTVISTAKAMPTQNKSHNTKIIMYYGLMVKLLKQRYANSAWQFLKNSIQLSAQCLYGYAKYVRF
jgi:hypothetical protein